jgi:hypothetical protein
LYSALIFFALSSKMGSISVDEKHGW